MVAPPSFFCFQEVYLCTEDRGSRNNDSVSRESSLKPMSRRTRLSTKPRLTVDELLQRAIVCEKEFGKSTTSRLELMECNECNALVSLLPV